MKICVWNSLAAVTSSCSNSPASVLPMRSRPSSGALQRQSKHTLPRPDIYGIGHQGPHARPQRLRFLPSAVMAPSPSEQHALDVSADRRGGRFSCDRLRRRSAALQLIPAAGPPLFVEVIRHAFKEFAPHLALTMGEGRRVQPPEIKPLRNIADPADFSQPQL